MNKSIDLESSDEIAITLGRFGPECSPVDHTPYLLDSGRYLIHAMATTIKSDEN